MDAVIKGWSSLGNRQLIVLLLTGDCRQSSHSDTPLFNSSSFRSFFWCRGFYEALLKCFQYILVRFQMKPRRENKELQMFLECNEQTA
jgi:hypothetical protein